MDKKAIIIIVLCIIGFVVFYSLRSCGLNNVVTADDTQNQDAGITQPEPEKPKWNSVLLQRMDDEYICWKKRSSMFIDSDKIIAEFRYEEHKYRLYIVGDNTRVLNFRGDNWERAAYYLGVKLPKCIESRIGSSISGRALD